MNKIAIENADVSYKVDGNGPGLVLVHGTGGSAENNWEHLVSALAENWTVVRPNYSGSGETIDTGGDLTAEETARQVVAAAKAAGAVPFDLVGFSLGSAISTVIAADYPHLVKRVVLLSPFLSNRDPRQKIQFELWRELIKEDRNALIRLILLTGFSPRFISELGHEGVSAIIDSFISEINWEGMTRQIELDISIDVQDAAIRISKPALIIGATHDHIAPSFHAKAVAATISGSRYVELDTGHLAHIERPDEFISLLKDFFLSGDK